MEDKIYWMFILAIPVSCIAWTVTKEQIFKEAQVFFSARSENSRYMLSRKIFYMFTCEYCFSHYVTILLLIITQYKLLYPDWRGLSDRRFLYYLDCERLYEFIQHHPY